MDTRSVIRSRRQSARLHSRPLHDTATKRSTSNKRISHTTVLTNKTKNPKPRSYKAATTKRANSTDSSTEASPAGGIETIGTAKCSTKSGDGGAAPMFPSLPSTKATSSVPIEMEQGVTTAVPKSLAEDNRGSGTEGRVGRLAGRVRQRENQTANAAVRLVDGTNPSSKKHMVSHLQELHAGGGQASSLPESRRRSARLASSTPGLEDATRSFCNVMYEAPHPPATSTKDSLATSDNESTTETITPVVTESHNTLQRTYSETPSDSSLIDIDELPPHVSMSVAFSPASETARAELTSSIPELVADIARIIETSSPIAARASTSNQQHASNFVVSTEEPAVTTYATSRFALLSALHADDQTEPVDKPDDDSCSTQTTTIDQSLSRSTSTEASHAEESPQTPVRIAPSSRKAVLYTIAASHPHKDSNSNSNTHGIKRRADEMSCDGHILARDQQLTTPSCAPLDSVSSANNNLIELAISRDCYENDDDELDSPDGHLWLNGEIGAAFRTPGLRNKLNRLHGSFNPHACISSETNNSAAGHPVYPAQPQPQAGPSRTTDQVASIEKHSATVSQETASSSFEENSNSNCGDCGKVPEKYLVCARCLKTRYCGKYCQIWNWPVHRLMCVASEDADSGESERQEKYLKGMWAGALRQLEEGVVDRHQGTDGAMGYEAVLQSIIGGSFMEHGAGEHITQQGIHLLGGVGTVAGEDGAGQQGHGVADDGGVAERRDGAGQHSMTVDREEETQQDEDEPDDHPITPESMFKSRARSLHLAQAFVQAGAMTF